MEEMTKNQNGNATEQTTTEETANEGKLFTQDEVNAFIQSRIARMKTQVQKEHEAEYAAKLEELNAREMKLLVKEKLTEKSMPLELADIITGATAEEIDAKLEKLSSIYGNNKKEEKAVQNTTGFVAVGVPGSSSEPVDAVRKAFGL